ncbi:MAG: MATE family efflux transporter [Oscillospiraceae bacterium]
METMPKSSNPLETEPLSKLLLRYSIPTTLTLMVNYLYSIVDQIFVGQGVGITGMAAVNVAFPVSILVNAVSLLLGDGCAANVSLCLGARSRKRQTASSVMPLPGSSPAALFWHWSVAFSRRRS